MGGKGHPRASGVKRRSLCRRPVWRCAELQGIAARAVDTDALALPASAYGEAAKAPSGYRSRLKRLRRQPLQCPSLRARP